MPIFCGECGAAVGEAVRFCERCGVRLDVAAPPPAAPPVALKTAPESRAGVRKLLAVSLCLLLGLFVVIAGAGMYLLHGVRQKSADAFPGRNGVDLGEIVTRIAKQLPNETVANASATILAAEHSPYPEWKSSSGGTPIVPLRAGLVTVGAVNQKSLGDFETVTTIQSVTQRDVDLTVSSEIPPDPDDSATSGPSDQTQPENARSEDSSSDHLIGHRTVRREDLRATRRLEEIFNDDLIPKVIPGTTAFSLSTVSLNELKDRGESQLTYRAARFKSVLKQTAEISDEDFTDSNGDPTSGPRDQYGEDDVHIRCNLKRVEKYDVAFPVIVNNRRETVPAIHAQGTSEFETSDWYILDDAENPLLLSLRLDGTNEKVQVVKITFPTDGSASDIEKSIQESGRFTCYQIYFNFKSASMRQESRVALKELAGVLERNPTWKVEIDGYTDNAGDDRSSAELSRERAGSVKHELVARYHIADSRLTAAGFGASRPLDSNGTLEGRACNRRVEFVRQ